MCSYTNITHAHPHTHVHTHTTHAHTHPHTHINMQVEAYGQRIAEEMEKLNALETEENKE